MDFITKGIGIMNYYLLKTETNNGQLNFATYTDHIGLTVRNEERERGIQIFAYRVEILTESEYNKLK